MNTPISDLQKGRLEKIVIENNTYDRYYEVKHEKEDAGLITRNQKDISAIGAAKEISSKLYDRHRDVSDALDKKHSKETEELNDKHRAARDVLEKTESKESAIRREKQKVETDALDKTHSKETKATDKKSEQISDRLKKAGLEREHSYNSDSDWIVNTGRFQSTYVAWMRDLRAQIITATSSEEAKKLVDKFLLK